MSNNAVIYIDYENIHNILRKYHTNIQERNLFEKLGEYCKENELKILDIFLYSNFDLRDMHDSFHQTWLLRHNVEIRHTSNSGKNFADLQIAVDVLEQVHTNENITTFIIISSDKDMVPLIKAIRRNNKEVHLITTVKDFDYGVSIFPNQHTTLEKLLEIKDEHGNEIVAEIKNNKEIVYDFLNEFVRRNLNRHIKLEYFLDISQSSTRLFKYELARLLKQLEQEGKVYFYEYRWTDNKTYVGIITDTYKAQYDTFFGTNITHKVEYITEVFINGVYAEFIR